MYVCSSWGQLEIELTYNRQTHRTVPPVIYSCSQRDQVMPLFRDNLHWLLICERILFKLCLMVFKALSGSAPSYITELCIPLASIRPRSALRLAAHGILFVLRTHLELGNCVFSVAGPASWNNLPDNVQSAPTYDEFKQRLKAHLFRQSYSL